MSPCTWSPPLYRATISPSVCATVPLRNQETVASSHYLTLPPATSTYHSTWCATMTPPFHRATWCTTMTPPFHRATWCTTMTPPFHRATWCATVTPLFLFAAVRHRRTDDTSAYIRTPTHLAYITLHLTAVNHTYWHSDAVSQFVLLVKIAMTTWMILFKKPWFCY